MAQVKSSKLFPFMTVVPFSSAMCLKSVGAVATSYQNMMGEYQWTKELKNNNRVYKLVDVDQFLQVRSDGFWSVCSTKSEETCKMFNPTLSTTPSIPGWKYLDRNGEEEVDDTFQVVTCDATINFLNNPENLDTLMKNKSATSTSASSEVLTTTTTTTTFTTTTTITTTTTTNNTSKTTTLTTADSKLLNFEPIEVPANIKELLNKRKCLQPSQNSNETVKVDNKPVVDIFIDPSESALKMRKLLIETQENKTKKYFEEADMSKLFPNLFKILWYATLPCYELPGLSKEFMIKTCKLGGKKVDCANIF